MMDQKIPHGNGKGAFQFHAYGGKRGGLSLNQILPFTKNTRLSVRKIGCIEKSIRLG